MKEKLAGRLFLTTNLFYFLADGILLLMKGILPYEAVIYPALLAGEITLALPLLIFALCTDADFGEMFPFRRTKLLNLFLTVILMLAIFPGIVSINAMSMHFVDNTVADMEGTLVSMPFPLMLIFVGVIGPVVEELTFRGYILQSFEKSGKILRAALFSALAFGCMHMNVNQALYAAVLGYFMARAVQITKSLWSSVIMHCLFNSVEVCMMFLPMEIAEAGEIVGEEIVAEGASFSEVPSLLSMLIGSIITSVLILRVMRWANPSAEIKKEGHEGGGKILNLPFVIGLIIAIVYMLFIEFVKIR